MTTFQQRLVRLMEMEGIPHVTEMSRRLGHSRPEKLRKVAVGDHLPSFEILSDIATVFPHVSIGWLITGRGKPTYSEEYSAWITAQQEGLVKKGYRIPTFEDVRGTGLVSGPENPMYNEAVRRVMSTPVGSQPTNPDPSPQGNIIVLDSRAAAGLCRHYGQQEYLADRPRISLHGDKYRGSDLLAIEVDGDSMMPTIRGGDWLVVRHLHHPREEVRPGYVHVVLTRDGAMAKRVYPVPKGDVLICKSDNHIYPPQEVRKADFLGLYLAVGLVRDDLSDQGSDLYNRMASLELDVAELKNRRK